MKLRIQTSLASRTAPIGSAGLELGFGAEECIPSFGETVGPVVQRGEILDWCWAGRAAPGERVSGDLPVVFTWERGALVGLIDGLGHGEQAAWAARRAADALEPWAQQPLPELMQRCHEAIRDTRGVVMTLVSFDASAGTATALGVGNVEAFLYRCAGDAAPKRETILLRGGVVGYQLPSLQATELSIAANDRLVFATDGIREDFCDLITGDAPLTGLVQRILDQKSRGMDDALVLACDYKGGA